MDESVPPTEREQLLATNDQLIGVLSDVARDLGFQLGKAGSEAPLWNLAEEARANDEHWIVVRFEYRDESLEVIVSLVTPGKGVVRSRSAPTTPEDVVVRAALLLRDVVRDGQAPAASAPDRGPPKPSVPGSPMATRPRSEGLLPLAVNATLYGGFVGYALQRSSGSEDPRILYPLMAVGAGVGLGGSFLVAEEWDVQPGDAWFVSGGAWWPTLASVLIYEGRFASRHGEVRADRERWQFGLVGGAAGLTMSTLGMALGHVEPGAALLSHSGGGLGLVLGGLTQMAVDGDIEIFPEAGMGYGTAIGWAGASAIAVHVAPEVSRLLLTDLGAVLGGLGGAALASPLVFDEPTKGQQRAWVGVTAGATLLGGLAGYFLLAPEPDEEGAALPSPMERPVGLHGQPRPSLGVVGAGNGPGPGMGGVGANLVGQWW